MTALTTAVAAFTSVDVGSWAGLPAGVRLSDLEGLLAFDREDRRRGVAGEPLQDGLWVPAESSTYAGGLRVWLDEDEIVVLLEGIGPVDGSGDPLLAPDLGAPETRLDAVLGPFHVADAERVYAGRGLALQVNPDNDVLVCLLGFTPTDPDDYRRRLHPHREPIRPLPRAVP